MSPELEAERELCERAKAGDRRALGALLETHGPRLFRSVLLPRLGSVSAAEEALGATYLRIVERFHQFAWQRVGVYPWFRVVALRVALDQLRARKREVLFDTAALEREIEHDEHDEHDAAWLEERDLTLARERVENLLSRLHPRYATALRLRILLGRSRDAAASELGVSVATFDVVLHRAMTALKRLLDAERTES